MPSRSGRAVAGWFVGLVIFAAAASAGTGCTRNITTEQLSPKERLEKDTGTRWVIKVDPVTGTPRIATALDPIPPSAVNGVTHEVAAKELLTKYKELFGLVDPAQELAFLGTVESDSGEAVATFQLRAGGLRIDRQLVTVAFLSDKSIGSIAGATRPRAADAVAPPKITADAARAAVEADLKQRYPAFDATWIKAPPAPEQVLYPDGPGAKLAWALRVEIESANVGTQLSYRVDATTGAILEGYEDQPALPGSGTDALGATRALRISENGAKPGTFLMVQPGEGGRSVISTGSFSPPQFPISSTSPTEWDPRATFQGGVGAAVSAHANLAEVQDFFRSEFKWSSFDNQGTPLGVVVHDTRAKDARAYWDTKNGIHFDDGDIHTNGKFKPFSASLDICAHEYVHGVMQFRVPGGGLVYQGESGAVSEGLADIFAVFAKNKITPGAKLEILGSEIVTGGFRDLAHPTNKALAQNATTSPELQQRDSFKKKFVGFSDNGGVHVNSGIVGNAFWLMTMGGVNDTSQIEVRRSIGIPKAQALWWEAAKTFRPTMTITDAADQTIATALRLFKGKSPEFEAVVCAWVATEVLTAESVKSDFDVTCGQPCVTSDAGKPKCYCRASDPKDGTLCKTKPTNQFCADLDFEGTTGQPCSGSVLKETEVYRCFCEMADGNILCPKPYQFTPPRGCPEVDGFKSYLGTPGAGCSGNYAGDDGQGNEVNKSGAGTLKSCSLEGTERKWENGSGTLECAGDDAGTASACK